MKNLFVWFLALCIAMHSYADAVEIKKTSRGKFAIKGGIAAASITWLGPVTTANFKFGVGGEYWFNNNWALGADLGMGSEGYGKVIGTTSLSMVNLKTGGFILDPGITGTFAFDPLKHFRFYLALRLGFPLRSAYRGAGSLSPTFGTLISINDYVALDLAASCSVVADFKGTYLATILNLGFIGFRVFI